MSDVVETLTAAIHTRRAHFDSTIGRLDRLLSEFLLLAKTPLDEADHQTIKHHAEDLIGVGNAALAAIGEK